MSAALSVALPDPFVLYRGGVLQQARIAYESWGQLNSARSNALLLFTGLSPSAHAASNEYDPSPGWWQKMIGPALLRRMRQFARQLLWLDRAGLDRYAHGPALSPQFPRDRGRGYCARRLRDLASAGHRAGRGRRWRLAGRHGRDRLCGPVSARCSAPDQYFRLGGRFSLRDRLALGAARSGAAGSGLAGRQLRA